MSTMMKTANIFKVPVTDLSLKEIFTYLGVEPTDEIMLIAASQFGPEFDMKDVGDFLYDQGILTGGVIDERL